MEIKNKKIIVTGGANGIGKELVKQLLAQDAYVCAIDINQTSLENLEKEINSTKLKTFKVDISSIDDINKFKDKYIEEWKNVDILINNAGIVQPFVTIDKLTDEEISRVMNVNFFGPLNLIRAFIKNLRSRKESYIVNISSMGGFFPFPKQSIYGASKSAIKLLTEGLYAELLDTNVKVMIVFPGAIATNILSNSNVKIKTTAESGSYKMLSAEVTAELIIKGIIKNKFKLYIGSDSKFMNLFYKFNSKLAIKTINKKMGNIN